MQVANQKVVTLDYTLTESQGRVIDQSQGGQFAYLHGNENIIPGLERALDGKEAGEQVNVTLEPGDAYGDRDERLIQNVPKDMFPEEAEVAVGNQFQAQGPDGSPILLTVTDVQESEVEVDANHPLAGETLNFDVKVVDVRDATDEELAHGHVHTDSA
ncbi:FKBP-type peptidyl-prolyl cis-trans isomerase [Halorhodospira neutriphila]|uniref:Peptidyl-prolyl cis-trans isomerase n=1 Tax=Halorhodospira neutriphila TaxID=168379 RepID=A0ABS1E600_9GAMM|nr:peptidylprolyl isomerase [Halorhodospira neutriphila]MBK1726239.1 peptidylprolyl isomerase [Halorhodospira neutriphila]